MYLLEKVEEVVLEHNLCLECLGRMFAGLSARLSNRERGRALATVLSMALSREMLEGREDKKQLAEKLAMVYSQKGLRDVLSNRGYVVKKSRNAKCEICDNIFSRMDQHVDSIMKEIEGYEFETYLVGVSVPSEVEEREDEVRSKHGLKYAESIRSELSREIGKAMQKRSLGKSFSLRPDLKVDFNPYTGRVKVSSRKLTLGGRISVPDPSRKVFAQQCSNCRGRGCQDCEYTGRIGEDTVEHSLGRIVLNMTGGRKWRFGIERIGEKEVLFLMSVFQPRKRSIKPEEVMEAVRKSGCDFSLEEVWIKARPTGQKH